MAERRSKSNKKFMLLSAIGILMVVEQHAWAGFSLFGDFIPYNSFFMPMFVFISGYFNKVDASTSLPKYLWKKVKTLLLPYVGLSLFVFLVQQGINWYKLGEAPSVPSWYLGYALDRVITDGSFAAIAGPLWFVVSLFATLVVYALLKKLLYKVWNRYVMLGLFCCLHVLVVYLAKTTEPESLTYYLVPLKVLFFLPFIELGILYRDRLEKKHTALSGGWKIAILVVMILANMVRMIYLPASYDVAFDSISDLSGFTSPYYITPLVSSLIGILFWLTLADLVGRPVLESRFINYMSCNTFWIMGLHILFFNLLNCVLLAVSEHITPLLYFDAEAFRGSEWYYWEIHANFKLVYVLVGVLGPLGLKWLWDRARGAAAKVLGSAARRGSAPESVTAGTPAPAEQPADPREE